MPQKANRLHAGATSHRVRVKGCGKSAPRLRQRKRHGKPHREQDRIGAARARRQLQRPGRSHPPPGLVARGWERSQPQMNGRRGGATLQTEPGLQASWQLSRGYGVRPSGSGTTLTPWADGTSLGAGRARHARRNPCDASCAIGEGGLVRRLPGAGNTPNLPGPGAVAQLGERLNGIQEVRGSIPLGSTKSLQAGA